MPLLLTGSSKIHQPCGVPLFLWGVYKHNSQKAAGFGRSPILTADICSSSSSACAVFIWFSVVKMF
jgi:hypothetical protein